MVKKTKIRLERRMIWMSFMMCCPNEMCKVEMIAYERLYGADLFCLQSLASLSVSLQFNYLQGR
jgi:hypothetical protein